LIFRKDADGAHRNDRARGDGRPARRHVAHHLVIGQRCERQLVNDVACLPERLEQIDLRWTDSGVAGRLNASA
jgi:hypothetical protein